MNESDIREFVKRRKISGGTRSDAGRRCRDTFASLMKTCRKLGVSFWAYLLDRVRGGVYVKDRHVSLENEQVMGRELSGEPGGRQGH